MGLRGEAFYLGRVKTRERENHAPIGTPRLPNEGVPFPLKKCSPSWETVRPRDQSILARRQAGLQICVPNRPQSPPGFPRRFQVLGRLQRTSLPPGATKSSPTGFQQFRRKGAQPLPSWGRSSGLVGQFGQDLSALRRDDHCVLELGGPETHTAAQRRSGLALAPAGRGSQLASAVG